MQREANAQKDAMRRQIGDLQKQLSRHAEEKEQLKDNNEQFTVELEDKTRLLDQLGHSGDGGGERRGNVVGGYSGVIGEHNRQHSQQHSHQRQTHQTQLLNRKLPSLLSLQCQSSALASPPTNHQRNRASATATATRVTSPLFLLPAAHAPGNRIVLMESRVNRAEWEQGPTLTRRGVSHVKVTTRRHPAFASRVVPLW